MEDNNKFVVYCAECDDPYAISIFEVDMDKDIYVRCIHDSEFSVGSVQEEKIVKGEYGKPSKRNNQFFDSLEEAITFRDELIEDLIDEEDWED